jgi:AraC-like DNA-binding protein
MRCGKLHVSSDNLGNSRKILVFEKGMEYAKEMLEEGILSVGDIGRRLGYDSPFRFRRYSRNIYMS